MACRLRSGCALFGAYRLMYFLVEVDVAEIIYAVILAYVLLT
jgi:hypothetical protein